MKYLLVIYDAGFLSRNLLGDAVYFVTRVRHWSQNLNIKLLLVVLGGDIIVAQDSGVDSINVYFCTGANKFVAAVFTAACIELNRPWLCFWLVWFDLFGQVTDSLTPTNSTCNQRKMIGEESFIFVWRFSYLNDKIVETWTPFKLPLSTHFCVMSVT